ncbi:2-keto-4-pentenoate hydratase [Pseudonocardia sp. DLS-67]
MQDLVDVVWDGALTGRFDATPLTGKLSVDDGERAQLSLLSRWAERGRSRAGWKVGLTSGAVRDSYGPGVRPFGFLLAERVFASGAALDVGRHPRLGLETELCFRVGRRLAGPDVGVAEVAAAVESVAPAFEINESRIEGPQEPGIRVADNLTQWGVVVGEPVSPVPDRSVFEATVSTLSRDEVLLQTVAAAGHIDDHFLSIARLVAQLSRFDQVVEAGDLVITGAFTRERDDLRAGDYVGTFSGIGEVRATVTSGPTA